MQFLRSGILSTYQDTGRNGYRYLGINPNGAMDKMAQRLLNILLQNHENEAVVEIHFPGPEILFEQETLIAIGGADFSPYLAYPNQRVQPVNNWQCTRVPAGSTLKFGRRMTGQRAYIAIKNGVRAKEWLGSKSTSLLLAFNTIKPNHTAEVGESTQQHLAYLGYSLRPAYSASPLIRLIKGNEYAFLRSDSQKSLENQQFCIGQNSNRMGFRLTGEALSLVKPIELISSAVDFGTVQLLPDGQLIILMADHQTTGGYPRIGNVVSVDLPLLAQCGAKDKVRFCFISQAEAEELLISREKEITKLKAAISFFR